MQPLGGFSMMDMMYAEWAHAPDRHVADVIGKVVTPRVLGVMQNRESGMVAAVVQAKQFVGDLADGAIGKLMRQGGLDKSVDAMKQFSDMPVDYSGRANIGEIENGMVKWLYASHLGLNAPTVVLNALQPWVKAAGIYGVGNILYGYKKAFEEMGSYFAKVGVGTNPEMRLAAKRELGQVMIGGRRTALANLDGEDVMGVTGSLGEQLDAASHRYGRKLARTKFDRMLDWGMAPFQAVETMNRLVISHAAENYARKAGLNTFDTVNEIRRANLSLNFGSGVMGTPVAALAGDDLQWSGVMGIPAAMMKSPLLRMFMGYPTRTAVQVYWMGKRLAGRTPDKAFRYFATDFMRDLGVSALVYQAGKSLLDADLSGGLFVSGATGTIPFASGGRFDPDKPLPLPLPPVIDIVYNGLKGATSGDNNLIANSLARLVPGGVALQRLAGVGPDLGVDGFQKTYADWNERNEQGQVPLYKSDGTLVGFQNPTELVLRGVGADLGRFQSQAQLDNMLVKNRDRILEYKKKYLNKVYSNDFMGAQAVADEYKGAYGVPLTVTKGQMDAWGRSREESRSERILSRMPPEVRGAYQSLVGQQPYGQNTPGQGGQRPVTAPQITPQQQAFMEAAGPASVPGQGGPFEGFGSY